MLAALTALAALLRLLRLFGLLRLLVGLLAVLARATAASTDGSGITGSREGFRLVTHLITYTQKKTYSGFWKTYRYWNSYSALTICNFSATKNPEV